MYTLADGGVSYLATIDNPHTKRTYKTTLDMLQRHFGQDCPLDTITPARVRRWVEHIRGSGYAHATKRKHIAIMKGFFSYLTAVGVWDVNPAAKIRSLPPQNDYRHNSRLTSKERAHLLDTVADNPRNLAMLRLISETGLTSVQIASLTPGDVSPPDRVVIYHEYGISWRVSFSDSTAAAVGVWYRRRSDESASLFGLSPSGVLQVVGRAYKAAGVRPLGIKGLPVAPVQRVDGTNKIIHMRVSNG